MDFFSKRFLGVFELHLLRYARKCKKKLVKNKSKNEVGGYFLDALSTDMYVGVRFFLAPLARLFEVNTVQGVYAYMRYEKAAL
jgi:hypothetical protein